MADTRFSKWFLACAAAIVLLIIGIRIPIGPEFLTGTLLASLVFHLWLRPSKFELASVATVAAILIVLRLHFGSAIPSSVSSWACFLSMLGLGSLLVQGVLLPFAGTEFRKRSTTFSSGLACLLFLMFSTVPLLFAAAHTPLTFDLYLLNFDRALGGDISFWIGRIVWSSRVLLYLVAFAYGGVALDVAIVVGSQMFEQRNGRSNLLLVLGTAGAAGYLLYAVVPATGPRFIFLDFPENPSAVIAPRMTPVDAIAVRNAMPSLHFSWTLLVYWMAWRRPAWVQWTAAAFLILTFVATMALGQHYFVDLVVALPFTMAIIGLSERSYRVAIVSAAILFSWLLALRFVPLLLLRLGLWNWLPIALTMVACGVLLCRVVPAAGVLAQRVRKL